ncbi:MAG TPA: MBL fold metallo-hydrolase [Bacteroidota bacterium]|nr:MBL fold metallo-hydrolase [Bacteroidota bacterium]
MNKITTLVTVLFCLGCCFFIACESSQYATVTTTKLEDNMWVLEGSDHTDMFLVEGKEKALLIDTGTKVKGLDMIVSHLTSKPVMVVITHAHDDHAGNINYFPEIWMHAADTVILKKGYTGKIHFVNDGDVFDLGGTQIEVRHMPAHTPGSIVLIDRKAGNCYSGDAFGSNDVWLQLKPLAPMQMYVNSCRKMEALMDSGITKIYCGHYYYVKKPFDKFYITSMRELAESLINGTAPEAKPYHAKVGCPNPMYVTKGPATIVFDPDYLNKKKE